MKKALVAISCALALGLYGCGGGGGDGGIASDPEPPTPVNPTSNVSGTANKGIVIDGLVTVCDATALTTELSCESLSSPDAYRFQTTTNANGQYQITGAPQDTPLLFTVENNPSGNTLMKCDIADCSTLTRDGSAALFGDTFTVKEDFKLAALLDEADDDSETAHITALTNIAAEQAFDDVGGPLDSATIATANQSIQIAFGLTLAITELGDIDITDDDDVNGADDEALLASLYSALVLGSGEDTDELLTELGDGYVVDANIVAAILDDFDDIFDELEADDIELPNLVRQEVDSHRNDIQDAIDNDDDIVVTPPSGDSDDAVATARAFVSNVRAALLSTTDDDLDDDFGDFGDELDEFDSLLDDDTDDAFEDLLDGLDALLLVSTLNQGDGTIEFGDDISVVISGNQYVITNDDSRLVASITNLVVNEAASDNEPLSRDIDITITSFQSTDDDVMLSATGTITIDDLVLVLNDDSANDDVESLSDVFDITASDIEIALANVALAITDDDEPLSFDGTIDIRFSDIQALSAIESNDNLLDDDDGVTFDSAELTFDGDVQIANDNFGLYIDLDIDNALGFVSDLDLSLDCLNGNFCELDDDLGLTETEDNFVETTLRFEISVDPTTASNNAQASQLELVVDRSGFDQVDFSLTITFDQTDIIIESMLGLDDDDAIGTLTIRNTSGAVLTLAAGDDSNVGDITIDGEKVADIVVSDDDLVVRYSDGTEESLLDD